MRRVGVYPPLALRRFGVILLNRVYFAPGVYPPLGGLLFLAGNPYMILYVYITIISGRNKYLKISESRQMRLASQDIQGILLLIPYRRQNRRIDGKIDG